KPDRAVFSGGGKKPAVRRECEAVDRSGVRLQHSALAPFGDVPELDRGFVGSSHGDEGPIRRYRDGVNAARISTGQQAILTAQVMIHPPGKIAQIARTALLVRKKTARLHRVGLPNLGNLSKLKRE